MQLQQIQELDLASRPRELPFSKVRPVRESLGHRTLSASSKSARILLRHVLFERTEKAYHKCRKNWSDMSFPQSLF